MNTSKKGYIPVMLTPFTEEGTIDYKTLDRLIDFYLKAGAVGLFANCLSNEVYELSPEERIELPKHIVEYVKGAVPVVAAGTFGGPITDQAESVKRVYATGVQAVIVITCMIAAENEPNSVFEERMNELLSLTPGVPLGFYECPVPYKRLLLPEQLKMFLNTGRIMYNKDTSQDIEKVRGKIAVCKEHENFGLYDAYMAHAVESLRSGSTGVSCIQGNYFPELVVWLCNNYNNASLAEEVDEVQQFLVRNMHVMHDVYPIVGKYFLQLRGFDISTYTRRKVGTMTAVHKENMARLLEDYNQLREKLHISDILKEYK